MRGGRAAFIIGASLHTCGLAKLVMKGRYSAYLRKIRVYLEDIARILRRYRTYLTKIPPLCFWMQRIARILRRYRAYLAKISRVSYEDIARIFTSFRAITFRTYPTVTRARPPLNTSPYSDMPVVDSLVGIPWEPRGALWCHCWR